jgi:DMSO/TMAO reductase YedYZ molybdopterin-dependent catalytic subunit
MFKCTYRLKKIALSALLLLFCCNLYAQTATDPHITVDGEVLRALKITVKDMARFKSAEVKAKDKEGNEHNFKGTPLFSLLDSAGVTLGKQLRGENLLKYILITAADGYQVVYALPEIDPEFTSDLVLLATHVDGKPLPNGEGPFRLVVPQHKKPTRWIREITSIKVISAK